LVLDFQVADLARRARPLAPQVVLRAGRPEDLAADDWYELALELEVTAPNEALEAYGRCLDLAPNHADAHLNLGRLLHEGGRLLEAERHYRQALLERPRDATAAFNLGVALQDSGRLEEALAAYRRAVEADPGYADAFFNMSGIYEELGKRATAFQNLKMYKKLTQ
jgi:tetratricopeptide (TPR) repeat protein